MAVVLLRRPCHRMRKTFAPTGQKQISPGQSAAPALGADADETHKPCQGATNASASSSASASVCCALTVLLDSCRAREPRAALAAHAALLCPGLICSGPVGATFCVTRRIVFRQRVQASAQQNLNSHNRRGSPLSGVFTTPASPSPMRRPPSDVVAIVRLLDTRTPSPEPLHDGNPISLAIR